MYKNNTIIQIGSHEGETINDPIFSNVDNSTRLILVEPVPYIFEKLKQNYNRKYSENKNIIFINKAVSDCIGEIKMTIPSEKNDYTKLPYWASQLGSINPTHALEHINNLLVEEIIVQTTTINEIVKEYDIKEIDMLHTDTEGHDYTILMNYDFSIKPKKVMFEHKHIDGLCNVGKKYEELSKKLESMGYMKETHDYEDTVYVLNDTPKV